MPEQLNTQITQGFRQWLLNAKSVRYFTLIAFLLCVAYYVLESINGRAQMADFRVYYDAANAFLHDTQLYGKSFGVSSGFYKYSPFATIPFIPLAILPYGIASVIYYLIISFCIIWFSLRLVYFISFENSVGPVAIKKWGTALFFISLFMADHLERELHLGNVNLFLLIGAFFIYKRAAEKKSFYAGILFGLLLLFKPHFLILLPYFIWKKEWRILMITVLSVAVGLFLPALIKGITTNNLLLQQWFDAMQDHNVHLQDSPNTIYGIINHFLLNFQGGSWLVMLLLGITGIAFIWLMIRNKKASGRSQIVFIEFFALIALIPNLAHTDTEHFMWTWPLIAFVIIQLFDQKLRFRSIFIVLMILAFIPYCVNSPDIVGRDIRFLFDEGGLLGVANLVIISVAVLISLRKQSTSLNADSAN